MKQVYIVKTSKDKNRFIRFLSKSGDNEITKSGITFKKSLKVFFIAAAMTFLLNSCGYLDYNELDQYKKSDIFYEFDRVKSVLTNVYSYLPNDYMSIDGAMRSSATDDAVHEWDLSDVHKFNDGSWNPTVTLDDQWAYFYKGIRTANVFLKEAEGQTFDAIKYNDNYEQLMEQFAFYPYEARFLRAFFYFELIKRYGDVPLVKVPLTEDEVNLQTAETFDNVLNFIVSECDEVSAVLPVTYNDVNSKETGRATKGAALALKARALLYAASPLHNTSNNIAKWVGAATASKAIIDQLATTYTPLPTYSLAVNSIAATAKELILEQRQASSRTFEVANTAVGFIGGNTGTCPTQNLVDTYEIKATGLGINEAGSGYDPTQPYAGRDPRLGLTVVYNGTTWRSLNVEIWVGGLNAPPKSHTTKTGYYLRKYLKENINLDPINPSTDYHYWVIFRYGEVLLNYAEAMNEAYGPEGTGPAPLNTMTALQAVNMIRARATMPNFPSGMTQSAFRTKLRNERRVELAFEDHRFWDIRRWKIGSTTTAIYGVDIQKDNLGVLTFMPKLVETRIWDEKMNLYPISQTELFINNRLVQNPGW